MATADSLLSFIENRGWLAATVQDDEHLLEINPVHGKIEAGFILWQRLPDGELLPVSSGHVSKGRFWGSENEPLELSDETLSLIDGLLKDAEHPRGDSGAGRPAG